MKNDSITTAVEEHYAAVARGEASGCGGALEDVARSIGYSEEELKLAGDANLGLGCGNPLALTEIAPGMTVVDLGSGPGFDAFLAWNRVGSTGRVIGVDMTDDMLALARDNAAKRGALRQKRGRIEVKWTVVTENGDDVLLCNWREFDELPVLSPTRSGFEAMLIDRILRQQFGINVNVNIDSLGYCLRMSVPLPCRPPKTSDQRDD